MLFRSVSAEEGAAIGFLHEVVEDGAALTTRQVVIANDPAHDPRSGGLPQGHPAMHAFLGLPITVEGEKHRIERLVGVVEGRGA